MQAVECSKLVENVTVNILNRIHTDRFTKLVKRLAIFVSSSHLKAGFCLIVLSMAFFVPGISSLQPMDRDEPRFAQASKQMLESNDFVDIRFQGDSRYKKPVGIYWLQSAAVKTAEYLGAKDAQKTIFFYRIPSLLGAIAAVLITYWTALAFLPRQSAFYSAALMSGCILLGAEARLAKTDAVLLATVLVTMGTLARAWFNSIKPEVFEAPTQTNILIFWFVIGVSLLIKGPITLMIALFPVVILSYSERSARWMLVLQPKYGFIIVALVVLPWFLMIISKTGTAFFSEAVGKDMLGKVVSGQERHGAPFGTYFGIFWFSFWPVAPLAALAAPYIFRNRANDSVLFLLAWIIPSWIVFEIVPTKLPHYVLPLFPAVSIAIMLAVENHSLSLNKLWSRLIVLLVPLVPVIFLVAVPVGFWILDRVLPVFAIMFLSLSSLAGIFAWKYIKNAEIKPGIVLALASSLALTFAAYPFGVSQVNSINLSKRLANAVQASTCENPKIATTTYREPSLVFLTNTDLFMTDTQGAAQFMSESGCKIVFVGSLLEKEYVDLSAKSGVKQQLLQLVSGLNINSGRKVDIAVYVKLP